MQNSTQSFIEEIVAKKREELNKTRIKNKEVRIKGDFSFRKLFVEGEIRLIAEVKLASPTNPHLGSSDDVLLRVQQYEKTGADAISFITEKHYFKGDTCFIPLIKKTVKLLVLQKDFVIDQRQIYEAKKIGSDALLLIARLVDAKKLKKFVDLCLELGIEPVVEINSEEDLQKAVATATKIIAVNARDLETFVVNIKKACSLLRKIPDRFIKLGFSGIHSSKEVLLYKKAGAKGVLVGTSLMQTEDIQRHISLLRGGIASPARRVRNDGVTKVKICGIQTEEDAVAAIAAGVDMLGFIFVPDSKRAIAVASAKKTFEKVKGKVAIVGVFKNNRLEEVQEICEEIAFDFVQLHGQEDQQFCEQVSRPVIKSFGLTSNFAVADTTQQLKKYDVTHYLIDRQQPGEGEMLSLERAALLANSFPLFFAGGLTPENVATVVRRVKPVAVDVISGVKTNGKFDFEKMKRFVANAKGVAI